MGVQILNNTFTNNHSHPSAFNDDGGQIDLIQCASNAAIVGNTVQNGAAASTGHYVSGIELHGSDLAVIDNNVIGNSADGIDLQGAANVFMANWNADTSVSGNGKAGIGISQGSGPDSLRPVDNVTIDTTFIANTAGWGIWSSTIKDPINHLSITNTCAMNNGLGPASLSGLGSDVRLPQSFNACPSR